MKKFLIAAIAALLLGLGTWHAVFYRGFYLDLRPDAPVNSAFRTEGNQLLRQGADETWTAFTLRGVDLSASMPGHHASEFAASEEDYLRWLRDIGRMGANTVRVYTVMDEEFYNALYDYNTTSERPLYLLQGIQVSDAANDNKNDAYHEDFLGSLLRDGKDAVDIVHGRKTIALNSLRGSGRYRRDVSQWTLGYLVGHEWDSETIAYTDHSAARSGRYQGEYFSTSPQAGAFEAMLAQVMDAIVSYESDKYKAQRLVGFSNDPSNDPFEYEESYSSQLSKYNRLDAENILPTEKLRSGYFAAYRLYDFCPDFSQYLSEAQRLALGGKLSALDTDALYDGYLQLLSRYHTMPVVAIGGVSSARGAVSDSPGPLTERQQGQALVALYDNALEAGLTGVCLSTWQDAWERRSWNTAFATALPQNHLWHDVQSEGQSYGLLAFDPGSERRVCVLDGKADEWEEADVVLQNECCTLSARYDEQGLYLLIRGEKIDPSQRLYVPIDITQESGSRRCESPSLSFDRAADFLLQLDGQENTRLLVQARYDALRENFLAEITGENPFVSYPTADSPQFVPVQMALRNDTLLTPQQQLTLPREQLFALQALNTRECGLLTHGNGDADSETYLSLSDFCFGEGCVEVRLPWLLLNVADPSQMQIHRDYYEYYGVRTQHISKLWLGLGQGTARIPLSSFALKGWTQPETHERLKQSYYVVQSAWKGGDDAAS